MKIKFFKKNPVCENEILIKNLSNSTENLLKFTKSSLSDYINNSERIIKSEENSERKEYLLYKEAVLYIDNVDIIHKARALRYAPRWFGKPLWSGLIATAIYLFLTFVLRSFVFNQDSFISIFISLSISLLISTFVVHKIIFSSIKKSFNGVEK